MKIQVIKRGVSDVNLVIRGWEDKDIKITYCGYIEVESPFETDLWDLCNWSCWTDKRPKECKHLMTRFCNCDVSYCINGKWYSHEMHKFKNFGECYNAMTHQSNKYFEGMSDLLSGYEMKYTKEEKLTYITPDNYKKYEKESKLKSFKEPKSEEKTIMTNKEIREKVREMTRPTYKKIEVRSNDRTVYKNADEYQLRAILLLSVRYGIEFEIIEHTTDGRKTYIYFDKNGKDKTFRSNILCMSGNMHLDALKILRDRDTTIKEINKLSKTNK